MIDIYRDTREATRPGDTADRHECAGPLKAKVCGVRVPVLLALWLVEWRVRRWMARHGA